MAVTVDSFKMVLDDFLPTLYRLEDFLAIIGLIYAGKLTLSTVYSLVIGIRAHFWSRLWKKNLVKRYGQWAVVTGSTDGIGKAYAHELAKDGLNIILISRTTEKLKKVSEEIRKQHGVETEIIQADFSDGESIYDSIGSGLAGKDIGVLVNNVGVMLPYPKYFPDITKSEIWSHVNVNMASVTAMTNIVLPGMLAKKKGAIINIASIAASGPIPLMGIYAASKAYVDYFSQALESEVGGNGITIQTVNPGYVSTNMTSFSKWVHKPSIVIPTAQTFAASALNTLGYTKRTTGYWSHGIQAWSVNHFCPKWMWMFIMKTIQKFLKNDYKHH